jgi:hypothetical protein
MSWDELLSEFSLDEKSYEDMRMYSFLLLTWVMVMS